MLTKGKREEKEEGRENSDGDDDGNVETAEVTRILKRLLDKSNARDAANAQTKPGPPKHSLEDSHDQTFVTLRVPHTSTPVAPNAPPRMQLKKAAQTGDTKNGWQTQFTTSLLSFFLRFVDIILT